MRSIALALAVPAWIASASGPPTQAPGLLSAQAEPERDAAAQELARALIAAGDPLLRRQHEHALRLAGESGARAALQALEESAAAHAHGAAAPAEPVAPRDLSDAAAPGRVAAAALVRSLAGEGQVGAALELCQDRDPLVRRELLGFLARGDLGPASLASRLAELERAALVDPDSDVRRECLIALGAMGETQSAAALARLAEAVGSADLPALGEALAATPAGRAAILALYAREPRAARLEDPALATALLPAYGRALAEADAGGLFAREREVLLAARSAPDPRLAAAALAGIDRLISRLYAAGDDQRAERVLAALADEGWNDADALFQAAWWALSRSSRPATALAPARELQRRAVAARGGEERLGGALGCYLEAAAAVAAGAPKAALEPLARAAGLLDGLAAERPELRPSFDPLPAEDPASAAWEEAAVEGLRLRALVEVLAGLALLADGAEPRSLAVATRARAAHVFALEAQLRAAQTQADMAVASFDALLELDLAPRAMLLAGGELPELPRERGLQLEQRLALALAAVAPREFPGFSRGADGAAVAAELPEWFTDPLRDPQRRSLLEELQRARLFAAEIALARLESLPGEERARRANDILRARAARAGVYEEIARADELDLVRQRVPSAAALALSSALRDEGRPMEALELATRAHAELESDEAWQGYLWRDWMLARGLMARAGAATDADRPDEAQRLLEQALERLEALENELGGARAAAGGSDAIALGDQIEALRQLRSSALTSLAVNANVKQADPLAASAWFEQAYAIDDGDFMKVLLACYRARSGRTAEARALLRAVHPAPALYYNLACTHALLGERELALGYLARELEENAKSRGQLERQRAWARGDPDLASLRGEARFFDLVGE